MISFLILIIGLVILVISADKFVTGASEAARFYKVSPLVIGMVVIGFGTSAPELVVTGLAAWEGNSGVALGNAFGSNIGNMGLILGITALLKPINVQSQIIRKELPILIIVTLLAAYLLWDLELSFWDGSLLLGVFVLLMIWTLREAKRNKYDPLAIQVKESGMNDIVSIKSSLVKLVLGLIFLVIGSRILVLGAVRLAQSFNVSDLLIGLTIVAVGTSLPELASSIISIRKGESDLALGNIVGSNLFNTLVVAGTGSLIHPLKTTQQEYFRDMGVMALMTFLVFILGIGIRGNGRINRWEGGILLVFYLAYSFSLYN